MKSKFISLLSHYKFKSFILQVKLNSKHINIYIILSNIHLKLLNEQL